MLDIKVSGLDEFNGRIEHIIKLVEEIRAQQKKQPEKDALMTCLNTMQGIVEKLILAHEELAGGQTEASIEARHAMNAAQMLKYNDDAAPFFSWIFPEEVYENQTKVRRLVKKPEPAKKPVKKGKRK